MEISRLIQSTINLGRGVKVLTQGLCRRIVEGEVTL